MLVDIIRMELKEDVNVIEAITFFTQRRSIGIAKLCSFKTALQRRRRVSQSVEVLMD